MKNTAVLLARSLAYIDIDQTDPHGRVFWPDLIKEISREFSFSKQPTISEWEEKKGLEFRVGKIGTTVIDALKIFDTLVVLETHTNTSDSQRVTDELLQWAKTKFELKYEPEMIRKWGFVNSVVFETDFPLLASVCKPLTNLGIKTSKAMSDIWHESLDYQPINLAIGHDPLVRKNSILPFSIQLRAESHFSDYRYFSEAPLTTDSHIQFLKEFEADILAEQDAIIRKLAGQEHDIESRPPRRIRREELPE